MRYKRQSPVKYVGGEIFEVSGPVTEQTFGEAELAKN
jgi:hypothetical protein